MCKKEIKTIREADIVLGEIKREKESGVVHVCAVCGTELIVSLNTDDKMNSKYGLGVFCPTDLKHINVRVMGKRTKLAF